MAAIAKHSVDSRRDILIAGAADTGLLAMAARATSDHAARITVLDRCGTPLELCRRFSRRWSLPIKTLRVDLQEAAPAKAAFDVVFGHLILQFIPIERRPFVMARLRGLLRPDGRLILVFRTSSRVEGSLASEVRDAFAERLLEWLETRNIALPEQRDAFHRRLEAYAEERRTRYGAYQEPDQVEELVQRVGFVVEGPTLIKTKYSAGLGDEATKSLDRRFLLIARPR